MAAILALSKISKRFGAVVVADGIDLALARRRGARHHRPERRRQDHAVRHHDRHGRARCRPRAVRRPGHHPHDAGAALPHGHRALVPDPAAVRRHDRVREPRGGGGVRRRPARARRLWPLRRAAGAMRPRRQGQPPGRQPDAARPQAARTRARARDRAARAAARRGRRRPDRARDRGAGRRWSRRCARAACRSSGSSTSCMR